MSMMIKEDDGGGWEKTAYTDRQQERRSLKDQLRAIMV